MESGGFSKKIAAPLMEWLDALDQEAASQLPVSSLVNAREKFARVRTRGVREIC